MPRFALLIEYDGTPFAGWQAQADQPSVQGAIETALARLDPGFASGARIAAAGRTDAGVHASGQVAHADLARDWDPFRLSEALQPWSMAEIFVIGTGVALVKIAGLASISFGPAFWAFCALIIVTVLKNIYMSKWAIWEAIDR